MNPGACHIYLFTFKHVYFLRRNPPHYQQHPPLSPLPSPPPQPESLPKHPESPPLYPESLPEYPTPPKFELLELDVQVVVDVAFKDQYERLFFSSRFWAILWVSLCAFFCALTWILSNISSESLELLRVSECDLQWQRREMRWPTLGGL